MQEHRHDYLIGCASASMGDGGHHAAGLYTRLRTSTPPHWNATYSRATRADKYGDSRVRSPATRDFMRDACRLRGGQNEHVVVVELDIANVLFFQSREMRWPREDDPYNPVPEGYAIAKFRKATPK